MDIGGHIFFHLDCPDPENGEVSEVSRKYTPTSTLHHKGSVHFVIKIYRPGVHPKFPHGGRLTQKLETLEEGDYLKMSGPVSKKVYKGNGNFYIQKKHHVKKNIGMVSGGTGITPFFQLIQEVVRYKDSVHVSLLFGNKTENDILLKDELDELERQYPDHISIHYIIDKPDDPENWKHDTGYVTKELLDRYMPPPSDDSVILTCGPKPMNKLVRELLTEHMVV